MDISRHRELFNPEHFKLPIHVIGAGATGSWVTLCLAKLGITNITVWDFDTVGEHNVPNQFFTPEQAKNEMSKVHALEENIALFSDVSIHAKNVKVDGKQKLEGVVFMLTDTMRSRKEIYEKAVKLKPGVKLLIETRMDLSVGRIYTINPLDFNQCKVYEETLYADEEAAVSACGASQSVITTAMSIASMAVRQMINWYREVPVSQELLLDFEGNNIYQRNF